MQAKAKLHNEKINKEIIESAKKGILNDIERTSSNLSNSNLNDQFDKIKQDSLNEV